MTGKSDHLVKELSFLSTQADEQTVLGKPFIEGTQEKVKKVSVKLIVSLRAFGGLVRALSDFLFYLKLFFVALVVHFVVVTEHTLTIVLMHVILILLLS